MKFLIRIHALDASKVVSIIIIIMKAYAVNADTPKNYLHRSFKYLIFYEFFIFYFILYPINSSDYEIYYNVP